MYIHVCVDGKNVHTLYMYKLLSSCTYNYEYSGLKGTILELISPRRPLKPRRKPTRKAKAQVDTCMSMILHNTFLYNRNYYYVQPHSSAYLCQTQNVQISEAKIVVRLVRAYHVPVRGCHEERRYMYIVDIVTTAHQLSCACHVHVM